MTTVADQPALRWRGVWRAVGVGQVVFGVVFAAAGIGVALGATPDVSVAVLMTVVGAYAVAFGLNIVTAQVRPDGAALAYRRWFRTRRLPFADVLTVDIRRLPRLSGAQSALVVTTRDGSHVMLTCTGAYNTAHGKAQLDRDLAMVRGWQAARAAPGVGSFDG